MSLSFNQSAECLIVLLPRNSSNVTKFGSVARIGNHTQVPPPLLRDRHTYFFMRACHEDKEEQAKKNAQIHILADEWICAIQHYINP